MPETMIFWWFAGIAALFAAFWAFRIPAEGAHAGYMVGAFVSFAAVSVSLALAAEVWIAIVVGIIGIFCILGYIGTKRAKEIEAQNKAKGIPDSRAGESNVLDLSGFSTKPVKKPKDD